MVNEDSMGNIDRLLGKLEQFMESAKTDFAQNAADHKEICLALDDLKAFKWKVIGVSLVVSVLACSILTVVLNHVRVTG